MGNGISRRKALQSVGILAVAGTGSAIGSTPKVKVFTKRVTIGNDPIVSGPPTTIQISTASSLNIQLENAGHEEVNAKIRLGRFDSNGNVVFTGMTGFYSQATDGPEVVLPPNRAKAFVYVFPVDKTATDFDGYSLAVQVVEVSGTTLTVRRTYTVQVSP